MAEDSGKIKEQFLANMSHEIRTPLQSIIGYAEQIRQDETPKRQAIDAIYHSSEHLLHIVNEVLDYSRIVSGRFIFENQPFEMKQLVNEVIDTMRATAEKKSIKLDLIDNLSKTIWVEGDAFRLRQVLYNLVGNAVKFTEIGQVALIISGKEMGPEIFFTFKVKDTGEGIPSQDIDKIFHVFEQATTSIARTHGGTGLGLSIVKTLVENQKGKIKVFSKQGGGSEFIVDIPFSKVKRELVFPKDVKKKSESTFKGKVLVVDDDAFIINLCATILKKYKIPHVTSIDPLKVLESQWDHSCNVVLLDIRMPKINGIDLCHALRKKVPQHVKIYAVTAQALPEEREAILNHGFDGILMKPFKEQELLDILNRQEAPPAAFREIGPAIPLNDVKHIAKCDLTSILKMVQGNEDQLKKILAQFVSETLSDLEALKKNISQGDRSQIREVVHRLAGRLGQLGSAKLSFTLRKMEVDLMGKGSLESYGQELKDIIVEIKDLIKEVDGLLLDLQAV
ncbi:MAG: ATP-binding protein, partial [Bacteroidota bacterium]|nr:ATP-binding protein [Bacteroidota bacterium]